MWCCVEKDDGTRMEDSIVNSVSALPETGNGQGKEAKEVATQLPPAKSVEPVKAKPATPVVPAKPDFGAFSLLIPTRDFASLGLVLDTTSDSRPMITEVKPGAVRKFNELNPSQSIMPYDVILALDEATSVKEIGEKLSSAEFPTAMAMKLSRPRRLPVHLCKTKKAESLGVKLEYRDDSMGVVIQQLNTHGLLPRWNAENLKDAVGAGDRIIAVNGKRASSPEIVEMIKEESKLDFTVLKY
ncbi:Thrombospondin-type laminin G domain and EAR repeat-containing protein [Durusdinium trenchii]|uniref:Thrombospondin-type laminin G domain and EAR repeat-containing protein n=1 Tax=Durusdinium trenchii TaxID=1381693 RepID=A0ABP0S1G1_9DINO